MRKLIQKVNIHDWERIQGALFHIITYILATELIL